LILGTGNHAIAGAKVMIITCFVLVFIGPCGVSFLPLKMICPVAEMALVDRSLPRFGLPVRRFPA